MPGDDPAVEVRRAATRYRTRTSWLDSWHSFSYGRHYDPHDTHFGLLLVSNHDLLAPGSGFSHHPHRDVEIVTWVLQGMLEHTDSTGTRATLRPGMVQWLGAGSGVHHAERNPGEEPVEYIQMWVAPDRIGVPPGYRNADLSAALTAGGWVAAASGCREAAAPLRQRGATLWAARLAGGGDPLRVPEAPAVHGYVARGQVHLDGGGWLGAGDAVRIRGGGQQIAPGDHGAELLVWQMHPPPR